MDKHARLPFLGLLRVSLLGVAFPLLLTSHNWAQANTKEDNSLLYAQRLALSTPQASKPAEVKETNPPPEEKKPEEGENSDDEKKQELPWFVLPIGLGVLAILYLGVLKFCPIYLLKLPAELKIPQIWIIPEFKLGDSVWHLLKYHPRVLDAWVEKCIGDFEKKFLEHKTVDERKNYVSLELKLNDKKTKLTAGTLRPTFAKEKQVGLLISGGGGTGKTAIACQIAKWAMMKDKDKRLTEHLILPILIEQGLNSKTLIELIVPQIKTMANKPDFLDELLVKQLLEQRRILLIVDHLSEMSEQSRNEIQSELTKSNVDAWVVISRNDETFSGIDIKIATMPFDAVQLIDFTKEYLKQSKKWEHFQDEETEFVDECNQLAKILGDQKIIVFLAKLYAERMINFKEKNRLSENSSLDNIPDLIIDYLENLNSQGGTKNSAQYPAIKEDAKLIAWKCLEKDYKAQPVERKSVVEALDKDNANRCLQLFEHTFHLIKSIGYSDEQIRFTLDPLAEYLAGLYLVEHYSENEQLWHDFLTKVKKKSQQEIKGFLLALRECCLTKSATLKIPDFVAEELGKLVGINLEAEKQQKRKQDISSLIKQLNAPECKDKVQVVEELQEMAVTDQDALNGLLIALQIDDVNVRCAAAAALGNLRNISEPVLIELLALVQNDELDDVRRNAVVALGKLGNTSELVLNGLLALLLDQNKSALHDDVAAALNNFDNASRLLVVDRLLARLEEKEIDVRSNAAAALGKLGNASEPVLTGLLARLQDKNDDVLVRCNTVVALGDLGNTSERVLGGLLARLEDKNDDVLVRRDAVEVLGKLENTSEQVIGGLSARLEDKNDDVLVRRNAVEVLGKLENTSEQVIGGLLARLEDKNDDVLVRRNAVELLGKLRNTSEQVIGGLSTLSKDVDEHFVVREAANKALKILNNSPENI